MSIDVVNTCLAVFQRDIRKVNVHRIAREIFQKQVDGRASMNSKDSFIGYYRNEFEQQLNLLAIYIIHTLQVRVGL